MLWRAVQETLKRVRGKRLVVRLSREDRDALEEAVKSRGLSSMEEAVLEAIKLGLRALELPREEELKLRVSLQFPSEGEIRYSSWLSGRSSSTSSFGTELAGKNQPIEGLSLTRPMTFKLNRVST